MGVKPIIEMRELCGHDEQFVSDSSTLTAINLLGKLLGEENESVDVSALTPWDRDLLLAQVYLRTYGHKVKSSVKCSACSEMFDIDFDLSALIDSIAPSKSLTEIQGFENGVFKLKNGRKFRLVTGHDELAVLGVESEVAGKQLVESCVLDDKGALSIEEVAEIQNTISYFAPIVDLDVDAECPECSHKQAFNYNLQSYLLTAIKQDKKLLVQEIHMLASSYGWGLQDILGLPRTERKALVSFIDAGY